MRLPFLRQTAGPSHTPPTACGAQPQGTANGLRLFHVHRPGGSPRRAQDRAGEGALRRGVHGEVHGVRSATVGSLLNSLIDLRLMLQPGAAVGRLRFPLDSLADHLAAAEQFERLEAQALEPAAPLQGAEVLEEYLAALEPRQSAEGKRLRGLLLVLRDGALEAQGMRSLAMPPKLPEWLEALGFLDPEGDR